MYTKVIDFREWIFKAIKVSRYSGGLSGTLIRQVEVWGKPVFGPTRGHSGEQVDSQRLLGMRH